METLLHQLRLPSPSHITKTSPWMERSSLTPVHPTCPLHTSSSNRRPQELQAQGKGFGVAITEKKPRPEKDASLHRNTNSSSKSDDDEDAVPQVVFDRILRRILLYVGTPMASGIGFVYVLSWLKQLGQICDVPGWLPFLTILLSFGVSGLGIAYGTLSTSWDPNKEGSLLGWEEAQRNWPKLWREDQKDKP